MLADAWIDLSDFHNGARSGKICNKMLILYKKYNILYFIISEFLLRWLENIHCYYAVLYSAPPINTRYIRYSLPIPNSSLNNLKSFGS